MGQGGCVRRIYFFVKMLIKKVGGGGGSWSGEEGLVTSLGVGGDVGYVGCENPTYPISRVDVYKELKFLWK